MTGVNKINCRKAAIFSDIHSNYHAFAACYADALKNGADCFIFLGDYISDLADPQKSLDLVYEIQSKYPTVCLLGNRERYMLECKNGTSSFQKGSQTGSLLYTYQQLRPQDFAFLESLPSYDRIELNGIPFEIAHSVQKNDRYYFDETDGKMECVFSQMQTSFLLTGHSHKQYIQCKGEKTIINPGSVGVPRRHGYLTQYAILEFESASFQCIFHQIPYDAKAMIRRQFESGLMEYAPHWAIGILYDVLTGEEYVLKLLERVSEYADGDDTIIHDEQIWHQFASEMGMKFTQKEIEDAFASGL